VIALLIDRDTKGTLANPNDDTMAIIGYAIRTSRRQGRQPERDRAGDGRAGNMQNVTIDYGTPPPR